MEPVSKKARLFWNVSHKKTPCLFRQEARLHIKI